ncbi:hypothetical protein [Sphingomonas yabuuchiae]|uniref:Uncharacterized protein n=1 Tax=Sphingomonas yabuuchiae TaxID=172044 RepID=A0AA40ZYY7_9SPHN|nr:hypothetical protein [Sphingomonas yabuuchiae]MBB4611508.1 hypothetical protein [Sphingomonas yabuuchiae]MBN3556950.1 hypothetical protein [Sphingomonas yabuuchiae]
MTRGIDLAQLNQVATAGEPRESVPVTRRYLAQVYAELQAIRAERAFLDFDPYAASRFTIRVPCDGSGAGKA